MSFQGSSCGEPYTSWDPKPFPRASSFSMATVTLETTRVVMFARAGS